MVERFFQKTWPIFIIFLLIFLLFSPFFLNGLVPMPADIIVGVYYPWLDYKWGYVVGVPVKNPLLSDIPSLLYPWRSFAVEQIKIGQFPLWNPFYFGGMPLLANFQSAVFSYVNIFFLFLPKVLAWSLGIIIQPFLTALFVYLFLRNRNLSKISSLLGAIVFAFCGFSIAWMEYNVHGHTAYFLPLLLLVLDKYFLSGQNRWLLVWSFLVAFQIFAGYIPIVIYSYLIIGTFILYFYSSRLVFARGGSAFGGQLIKLTIFWILGLALAAVQLLSGIELVKLSIREIDPIVKDSRAGFLPLSHLATLLTPDFFGNPATGNWWGQAFYDNFSFYAGTVTIILVFLAIFSFKKDKFTRFWIMLLAFSFLMAIKNPFGEFLQGFLGLRGGVPARALFITDFALAMLAAAGLESILKEKTKIAKHLFLAILVVGMAFIGLGGVNFLIGNPIHRLVAQRNLIIPGGIFVLSLPLFWFAVFGKRQIIRSFFIFSIFGLISFGLLYSARKYLPFSKPELVFPTTPVIEFLQKQEKPFRFEPADVIPQNFWMAYGLEAASGSDALLPKRMGEFLTAVDTGKIEKEISRVHLLENYDSPLFSLLNVKYILAKYDPSWKPPERFQGKQSLMLRNKQSLMLRNKQSLMLRNKQSLMLRNKRYKLVFEDKTVQVWEDSKALPRAFWVHDFEVIKDSQTIVEHLSSPGFNFRDKLILEESPDFISPKEKSKENKVEWLEYQPGEMKLVVESDQPGFILLANNFYPGWQVYLDNQKTKIYRADYTFWATKVSSGKHLVDFFYQPKSFLYGSLISGFSLVNLLLFSGILAVKRLWQRK